MTESDAEKAEEREMASAMTRKNESAQGSGAHLIEGKESCGCGARGDPASCAEHDGNAFLAFPLPGQPGSAVSA